MRAFREFSKLPVLWVILWTWFVAVEQAFPVSWLNKLKVVELSLWIVHGLVVFASFALMDGGLVILVVVAEVLRQKIVTAAVPLEFFI